MRASVTGLLVLSIGSASALAQQPLPSRLAEYHQSSAVLARYPEIPLPLATPALAPGRNRFTSQEEMLAFLQAVKARAPHAVLGSLGTSLQGRDIPFLLFTAEGLSDPAAVRALDRPIIWLIGQQHGNEPAGGEGMLAVAAALAHGELKPCLDRATVVVVPRANPDGAAAHVRVAANGLDLNRDHLLLSLPEARALHAGMTALPPDVVLDGHEFQVAGTWLAKFGALQKSDAMLLYATHPAVPRDVVALAQDQFLPAIEAAFRSFGLTSFWYHTTTSQPGAAVSMGGNAPGIARNAFGLIGAVSFLIETRGIGVGIEGFQRRVATHYVAARAIIETAARNPEQLRGTVARARQAIASSDAALVVGHRTGTLPLSIPMIDPRTGSDRVIPVQFRDTRQVTVIQSRARPAGYLVQPEAESVIEALTGSGATICRLEPGRPVVVEAFRVSAKFRPVNRESINPEQEVAVTLEPRTVTPPAGTIYVPMRQPTAEIVAASLEPDSPGSQVGVGLVPVSPAGETPIYRVPAGTRLPVAAGSPAACGGP